MPSRKDAPLRLKLNGKPLDLHPDPPVVGRIRALLDKLPDDELFTTEELGVRAKVNPHTLHHRQVVDRLGSYTARICHGRYWGSQKAVAELLRQAAQ